MNTDNALNHLRMLWRTDKIIADIKLRQLLVSLGLRALAALIAVFGLLMFELATYFWLVQTWSAISAAAILGAIDVFIAVVLLAVASRPPAGRDLDLANEIHKASMDALQVEARAFQSQIAGTINHPLDSLLPHLALPLINIVINSLRRHSAAKSGGSSD